jgi:hypothetical protein
VNIREAKKLARVEFNGKDVSGIERALAAIKSQIIAARKANDDDRAKILSEAKQLFKKMMPGKCVECGATINPTAVHCRLHQPKKTSLALPMPSNFKPAVRKRVRKRVAMLPNKPGVFPLCTIYIDGIATSCGELNECADRLPLYKTLEATTAEYVSEYRKLCDAYEKKTGNRNDGHAALFYMMNIAEDLNILQDPRRTNAQAQFMFVFATVPEFAAELFKRVRAALPEKNAEHQKALLFLRTAPEAMSSEVGLKEQAKSAGVSLSALKKARREIIKNQANFSCEVTDTEKAA